MARAQESREGEIQVTSHGLVEQLDSMIDEYDRNGLKGDELKSLKGLRNILGRVSDQDMAKILAILRQAGVQNNPGAALNAIADAYSKEKGVLIEMKRILASYASAEEALELSQAVNELADRQAANLQSGVEAAEYIAEHDDQTAVAASLQGQGTEQKSIADEMTLLEKKIADFAKDPNNATLAERFNKGVQDAAKIDPVLASATDSLGQRKLFESVTTEKTARDQLRQLARAIAPPEDESEALREAAERLDRIISQQKDVIVTTAQNQPANCPALESHEGDLANQTDSLIQDLQPIAKPVADTLVTAIPQMQNARSALLDKNCVNAGQPEKVALADLEAARDLLEQQILAQDKADEKTGDPITDLQNDKKQVDALARDQAEVNKETPVPKTPDQANTEANQQKALDARAENLQQQIADQAPDAAKTVADAANNMQQAAATVPNAAQNPQTQAQQANAMQNLAKASDQLQKKIDELQKDQQQLAQAQKDLAAVEKIIEEEQKLNEDTIQVIPQQVKQPASVLPLAPRQGSIRQETDDFQKTVLADNTQPNADERAKIVASASGHMGDAQAHLLNHDATHADPDEKKALDDLYKLKDDLQAQIQAQQAELAQQNDAAEKAAADAAAAIAKAQTEMAQAQNDLAKNQDPQAAQQADQAQATAADAAAKGEDLPQAAQDAMRDAAADAAQAQAAAAAGQTQPAQAAAAQAQADLAKAAGALAPQLAGLNEPGQNQPGQPEPSDQPGNKPGKKGKTKAPKVANLALTGAATGVAGNRMQGNSHFLHLPERDRKAIEQSQSEKYPQQYAAKVEQYLENLASDDAN